MLITFGEEEREEWIDFDDFSDMDEAERAPYEDGDELNTAVPAWAPKTHDEHSCCTISKSTSLFNSFFIVQY
jgi:hypothetical protein